VSLYTVLKVTLPSFQPISRPTLLAAASFVGLGLISSDVYTGVGQDEWYENLEGISDYVQICN
jgi:hypothetical protein